MGHGTRKAPEGVIARQIKAGIAGVRGRQSGKVGALQMHCNESIEVPLTHTPALARWQR
jgi:hypothetical protein